MECVTLTLIHYILCFVDDIIRIDVYICVYVHVMNCVKLQGDIQGVKIQVYKPKMGES